MSGPAAMQYPLVLSSHKRIVIAPAGWFDAIGRIAPEQQLIELAISKLGEQALAWFLDANGLFYALRWQGRLPKTLLQRVGLQRQRERYAMETPMPVSAGRVLALIADHREQFEEAPHTAELRAMLQAVPADTLLGPAFMSSYLGLPAPGTR